MNGDLPSAPERRRDSGSSPDRGKLRWPTRPVAPDRGLDDRRPLLAGSGEAWGAVGFDLVDQDHRWRMIMAGQRDHSEARHEPNGWLGHSPSAAPMSRAARSQPSISRENSAIGSKSASVIITITSSGKQ